MTTSSVLIREGCLGVGLLLNEPMGGEPVRASGDGTWSVGPLGTRSEGFPKITLTARDLEVLNERYVAEDQRDGYCLYVVTNRGVRPPRQQPVNDPAPFPWPDACLPRQARRR